MTTTTTDNTNKTVPHMDTQPESFCSDVSTDDDHHPIVYTREELQAMKQVRDKLVNDHGIDESRIGLCFLAVATINSKLRVDETVTKLLKFLELMEKLQCPGMSDDLWQPEAAHELAAYMPSGKDYNGCSTIWIRGGGKVATVDECHHVQACMMHFLAVHADARSLREGITMVIDVTQSPEPPKIGNEATVQAFYQAFPQRPQSILIAGTNAVTRVIVNTTIKIASVFIKQKILDRIQFVTVQQAKEKLPLYSVPTYIGGMGGGIPDTAEWVQERLQNLPKPDFSQLEDNNTEEKDVETEVEC